MKHTLVKNGVTFEVDQQADHYGQMHVVATLNGKTQHGKIPGSIGSVYPRISFLFCSTAQWLHERADRRSWAVDDYEELAECNERPTDNCEFALSSEEVAFLNSWRLLEGEQRYLLQVALGDANTAIIRSLRQLTLTPEMSWALRDMYSRQAQSEPISEAEYQRRALAIQQRYQTDDLLELAEARQ